MEKRPIEISLREYRIILEWANEFEEEGLDEQELILRDKIRRIISNNDRAIERRKKERQERSENSNNNSPIGT